MIDNKRCGSGNNQPMPGAYIDVSGRYIDEWGHPAGDANTLMITRCDVDGSEEREVPPTNAQHDLQS